MNLEERINKNYDSMTANDKEMIHTILGAKKTVAKMNSTQLAAFLNVSRTTFVRLMKKLDIDTYSEFKLLLMRRDTEEMGNIYNLQDIVNEYHSMISELKKHDYTHICEMIYEAETIYLYGSGNEQKTIAKEFKRIFLTFGKHCVDLFDKGEIEFAKERFKKNDVLVVISLSGENKDTIEAIRIVSDNIKTISLTRWENNVLARMCQENLYVGTKKVLHQSGQSYEMVAMFYILLDILSVRYLEYLDRCSREEENKLEN